ncbi:MAG: PhzF family phenazine biosynthesis protein [Ottowia sp.]|nr:PhzF family phenazine biosynthesis protein [Ottowia sp.]
MNKHRFQQVDVFTQIPFKGNPLAVVLDADNLTDDQMQAIARWTNLSETTFVLSPTDPHADYRVRIFSPSAEFPFAGHPTLGTAHALLETGIQTLLPTQIVQQCGIGLVPIRMMGEGSLAFRAPAAELRPLDKTLYPLLQAALASDDCVLTPPPIVANMGIRWLTVRMQSARDCLAVCINANALSELIEVCDVTGIAFYGAHDQFSPTHYEVRALFMQQGLPIEDPVTGSANACIARVLQAQNFPDGTPSIRGYSVRQGTPLQRDGRLSMVFLDNEPWISGQSITMINGQIQS